MMSPQARVANPGLAGVLPDATEFLRCFPSPWPPHVVGTGKVSPPPFGCLHHRLDSRTNLSFKSGPMV